MPGGPRRIQDTQTHASGVQFATAVESAPLGNRTASGQEFAMAKSQPNPADLLDFKAQGACRMRLVNRIGS
jgi:hypothetical protein